MTATLDDLATRSEPAELPPFPVRRWTLDEYHALIDQGMFEDERVELLEGWIVPKMTTNPPHAATISLVHEVLQPLLPSSVSLRIQSAVTIGSSEPEPDLAVVQGKGYHYTQRHPGEGDIHLVIEVADTSLRKDRLKARIYARAGILNYWIINLEQQQIETFWDPSIDRNQYVQSRIFQRGESLVVHLADKDLNVPIDWLLLPVAP